MPTVRARCDRCLRPQATCLCDLVVPVPHRTEVLVLQHPLEAHHPKGSARLLHLSLAHSRLAIGERFDEAHLAAWTGDGAVLLYPGADPLAPSGPPLRRLVVLDATWRKSRLMLHANPLLQRLPRLTLAAPPPSRYTVREAHAPHQRSTLEATLLALAQLDGPHPAHASLLTAFDALQQRWARRGRAPRGAHVIPD